MLGESRYWRWIDSKGMTMKNSDVSEKLRAAVEAIEAADVPDDLREVAFSRALDLLAGVQVPVPVKGDEPVGGTVHDEPPSGELPEVLERIAAELDVPAAAIERVYRVDGEKLDLEVPPSALPDSDAGAARQIALLIAAGRQLGGLDEKWTDIDEIRDVCVEYSRYDVNNFATSLKRLRDELRFGDEGVRITRPGKERAQDLVRRLGGAEE